MTYTEFLQNKAVHTMLGGFDIDDNRAEPISGVINI